MFELMQQLPMETLWAKISNVPGSTSVCKNAFSGELLPSCEWNFLSPKEYEAYGLKELSL